MTPVIMKTENRDPFQNLISQRVWELLDQPGVLALGAVDEGGLACAALVCRVDGAGTAELLWLFTAENRRREGAASLLLDALRRALRGRGYRRLFCLMPDDGETDGLFLFFLARNALFSPAAEDLAAVPLKSLVEWLEQAGARSGRNCLPLEQIPKGYIHMALRQLPENKAPLLDRDEKIPAFHPGSCGIVENGQLTGLILLIAREAGDGVAMVLLQAAKPEQASRMLYHAASRAAKICPPGSVFTFATLDGQGRQTRRVLEDLAFETPLTCAVLTL